MMKNTFYHPSLPSEFFSIENSEFRMANLEAPSLVDTKMRMHNNGYCFHPPGSFPADNNWLRGGGGGGDHLDFSDQHILNLQPGHEYMTYSRNIPQLPPPADALSKTMKRPLEGEDGRIAGEDFGESSVSGEWKKSKRKRAVPPPCSSSSQCHHHHHHHHHTLKEYAVGIPQRRFPVRRSQKIGDKITALQKLVSPYGKTDTASVLQEASLYIKFIQYQIQNLFQMLTNSYSSIRGIQPQLGSVQECWETSVNGECQDLRSRGLCLVPISSVREVAAENHVSGDTTIY